MLQEVLHSYLVASRRKIFVFVQTSTMPRVAQRVS